MTDQKAFSEARRLEQLWSGRFGDEYVDRNTSTEDYRRPFWNDLLRQIQPRNVLEVGCNLGANLRLIAQQLPAETVWGIDVNRKALQKLRTDVAGVNAVFSPARSLPFRDRWFDLVFTMGVLIHQPDSTLPLVMSEVVRCSERWVLCAEYFATETTEVPYYGHRGALLKRDYPGLYRELFPELTLVREGFLGRDQGWDDVTWWLFERK